MPEEDQPMKAHQGEPVRPLQVALADGRPMVRWALKLLLEEDGGMTVSTEATTAGELLERVRMSCPDVIVLDCDLPGLRLREYLPQLRAACPRAQVVALCSRPEMRRAVLSAGSDAFVCKMEPPETLVKAVRRRFGLRASKSSAKRIRRHCDPPGSPDCGCRKCSGGAVEEGREWDTQARSS